MSQLVAKNYIYFSLVGGCVESGERADASGLKE
jgi:hypothetical protein